MSIKYFQHSITYMIRKRNWRDVYPTIAHKSGIDWRLLTMNTKTMGDIDVDTDPIFQCLRAITYVSLARLQPGLSYKRHIVHRVR